MPEPRMLELTPLGRRVWLLVILAAVYATTAKLGLKLAFEHPSASAVWPPSGIALAAALLWGPGVWPSVLVGAFVANVTTAGSALTSVGIAIGNTLEMLIGWVLVTRLANGRAAFDRPQDIFKFAAAVLLAASVSPSWGVTSLALGGFADWTHYGSIWLTWWLGDAGGALIVAPFLLLWSGAPRIRWTRSYAIEVLVALAVTAAIAEAVFGGWPPVSGRPYALEFLTLPGLVWVAFRLGRRATATAVLLLSAIAIGGTLRGFGPFADEHPDVGLVLLEAYMSVIAVMALVLAAAIAERERAERDRREQIAERERAYHALRRSEDLHRAIAELASDFALIVSVEPDGTLVPESATEGFAAVTGYELDELAERGWQKLLHPEDVGVVGAARRRVLAGERVADECRIVQKSGAIRWLRVHSQPYRDTHQGRVVRVLSAAQDVTDRRQALEELERQHALIRELSTPVLRVRDRLLILPVIGQIDAGRALQITEQLLDSVRRNRAKVIVIDLTGVASMDAGVAEHLLRTVQACRVLGASVIMSGVSRQIGNALVNTGADLSQLVTQGDLQGGIEEAQRRLGSPAPRADVVRRLSAARQPPARR